MRLRLALPWVLTALLFAAGSGASDTEVWVVDLEGAVGPASVDLIIRSIDDAYAADAEAVIIRMDTPGGLDKAMRELVQHILNSPIPVVTYVAPNGARAASAGTYIAYASHVAAMAPASNIGSSTPVSLAPQNIPSTPASPSGTGDDKSDQPPAPLDAMGKKVINDAVAYLQSLAELRDRNIEWAEETVREGANLRASVALELNVINLIAADLPALLEALDQREVALVDGKRTLNTAGATVHQVESDWRHDLLATITDPSIAYGMLIIGIYALILEFYNPGLVIPSVTGIILILLGAYGLQLLPVNYAGLALLLLGVGLMVAEVITPTFGVLGIGGVAAFVMGSLMLFDSEVPGYQLPIYIIAAFATITAALIFLAVGMAIRARNSKIVSGVEAMLGAPAIAQGDFASTSEVGQFHGDVLAFGEIWQADADTPITGGEHLRVCAVNGLILQVEQAPPPEAE